MDYQVTATAELTGPLTEAQLGSISDALAKYDAAVAGGTPDDSNGFEVTMSVSIANHPLEALTVATENIESTLFGETGHAVLRWISIEAVTVDEADRRLDEPTIPELVSGVEAAEILGVSRQRVHQLSAENTDFPPPVARLASGSVWLRAAVEGFAQRWERKPGRPSKARAASGS